MMRRITRKVILLAAVAAAFAAMQGAALAAPPAGSPSEGPGTGETGAFLCPAVGDGVTNADLHNGDNGVSAFAIRSGASFFPGNNQAGPNANGSAVNELDPSESDGPGGQGSGWSPIWPNPPE